MTDIKSSTYIEFAAEYNYKDTKFEVADYMTISKYKNILAKRYSPN